MPVKADVLTLAGTTIDCRCEDIRYNEIARWTSARAASVQTRCGIGLRQGHIRGAANHFLFGWSDGRASAHLRRAVERGVIPAITRPFHQDLRGSYDFVATHCRWLIENGCSGVVALGSLPPDVAD